MNKYLRLLGVIILCYILLTIDLTRLLSTLLKLNIQLFIYAIFLNIPGVFLKSFRWNQLLKKQSIQYNLKDSFLVYLSSIYAGIITPGRLGEFVKALYLKSDKGVSLSKGMSSVFIDRLLDMYLLIILGIVGVWQLGIFGEVTNVSLILIITIVLAPLILLNKRLMSRLLSSLYYLTIIKKVKSNIAEKFDDFYEAINQLINYKLIITVLLTCVSYLIFFIQCYLIAIALGISINFITIIFFMAISNLISFIPISISGLGTRDVTLIYLFSLIGLKAELAVSYAFLVFIIFYVCGGLMGAVAWWMKPLKIKWNA